MPESTLQKYPVLYCLLGFGFAYLYQEYFKPKEEVEQLNPLHDYDPSRAKSLRTKTPLRRFHRKFKRPTDNYVYRVALTGGPCSGKTSVLKAFTESLTNAGFDVYIQPESATMLLNGGFHVNPEDRKCIYYFERAIMFCQLTMERSFVAFAKRTGRPSILICDRGLMDPRAYLTQEEWEKLLQEEDWSEEDFLKRYDLVIHMVTAAYGAETSYTLANNQARMENPEEAIEIDMKLREAWKEHEHFHIIKCRNNFEEKAKEATSILMNLVQKESEKFKLPYTPVPDSTFLST